MATNLAESVHGWWVWLILRTYIHRAKHITLTLHSELVPDKSMVWVGPEEKNLAFYLS